MAETTIKIFLNHPYIVTFLVAIATICGTIYGTVLTTSRTAEAQRQLEFDKFEWQKGLEVENQKRRQLDAVNALIIDFSNKLARATYENGSFLESVKYHPEKIDLLFERHEDKMKELMAEVVSSHAALAAVDRRPYELFVPLIKQVSQMDLCLTEIYRKSPTGARGYLLSELFSVQRKLMGGFPEAISSVIRREKPVWVEVCNPMPKF